MTYAKKWTLILVLFTGLIGIYAQENEPIPAVHSKMTYDEAGNLLIKAGGNTFYAMTSPPLYSLQQVYGNPVGTENGLIFDFGELEGTLTYGLIPYGKAPHPVPVFRFTKSIVSGKAEINIPYDFRYPYDFVGWKETGFLTIGYRLQDTEGMIIYDGEVSLSGTGPFEVVPAIAEGPFINGLTDTGIVIWCRTTLPVQAQLEVNGQLLTDPEPLVHHEWAIDGLEPATEYNYTVKYGGQEQQYHFRTAPRDGSREPFVFAYTSDSRHATGGGERMIYGANAYIMKKMAALAHANDAAFLQFTGDMINGYLTNNEETQLQYTNWKKALEPFWHYMPVNSGMGNHEALGYIFTDTAGRMRAFIDGFPYDTFSAEAAYAEAFVNPVSDLVSEDGCAYDPDPDKQDFPSYSENVYTYRYGNVGMIVLNSDYWYAPTLGQFPFSSGGLHGYIMDMQLEWLRLTVAMYEQDSSIDHVFVTQHTPAFPNGGHSRDDMWYSGNNQYRPFISGKPVAKGIIERRDEYLDILINQSTKVLAILTGDEHNYNWLKLTPEVPIYPEIWPLKKLNIGRPIYQINNGAAGAPYYAQEILPWSEFTQSFSVENALCLFYVEGSSVKMRVLNPDTLNEIDSVTLRE
ncbi:MAG: hypothetical protein U9R49_01065 [Bacteroidota bacterium]|nr:hypothetical protein [Bacteroidota bacterium]